MKERIQLISPEAIQEAAIFNQEFEATKERVRDVPVTIVIPPSVFLADERVFPFLGALKVAAELERNGNQVDVLDLSGVVNFKDATSDYARRNPNRVFGLTATTPQIPAAILIRNAIKSASNSPVILGGTHATLTHSAFIKDQEIGTERRGTWAFEQLLQNFDRVVAGDGEMSIFPAIDPENPDQIIDASSRTSPYFLQRGTLEQYAYPARHMIDLESYHYYIDDDGEKYRAASIIAQLGCPFECGFCGGRNTDFLRMTRTRNITNSVLLEFEQVVRDSQDWEIPIRGAMFYDDELNVNKDALEKLCRGLIEMQDRLGIEMRFRGFIKAELFTPEQASLMYAAGFRFTLSGVESGSREILDTMRKHTTPEINSRAVQIAHDAGMSFKALMSVGHPGESKDTISESIVWVNKNLRKGDDVDWTLITQYPGSPYYDDSVYIESEDAWLYTEGETGNRLWSKDVDFTKNTEFYKGVPGNYESFTYTDYMSPDDLVAARDAAEVMTRSALGLPPIREIAMSARQFEHSMGQGLSPKILRSSQPQ